MLELSMTLPIKVQNGGLFISRGVGGILQGGWSHGKLSSSKKVD